MTWLVVFLLLFIGAIAALAWVATTSHGHRIRRDDDRRSADERERARQERAERRRRLNLPDDEDRHDA